MYRNLSCVLFGRLIDWSIGWWVDWLIYWLIDWLIYWLIDWLIDPMGFDPDGRFLFALNQDSPVLLFCYIFFISNLEYGNIFAREIQNVIGEERERPWLPVTFWQFKTTRPHMVSGTHSFISLSCNSDHKNFLMQFFRVARKTKVFSARFQINPLPTAFRSQRLSVPVTKEEATTSKLLGEQIVSPVDLAVSILEFNALKLVCSGHNCELDRRDPSSRQIQACDHRLIDWLIDCLID